MKRAADLDRFVAFVAFITSRRVPTTINEIVAETGYSRASVFRHLERLRAHFPLDYQSGGPSKQSTVRMRQRNG